MPQFCPFETKVRSWLPQVRPLDLQLRPLDLIHNLQQIMPSRPEPPNEGCSWSAGADQEQPSFGCSGRH